MKQTLLELVQDILSDIDGDEVNSITDTEESEQVARHIKAAYRSIVSNTNWPHTRRAVALDPRSDSNFPTHMVVKEEVKEMISVRYNTMDVGDTRREYQLLRYYDPDEFLRRINKRNNDEADVDIVTDDSGIELLIFNDKDPQFYTSFDDVNLIFDSYDSLADSTLQGSKFQAQGYIIPTFTITDAFTPDLPVDGFSLLYEESVSRCQFKMRQFEDRKAEAESQRQSRWMSRKNWVVDGGIKYPDYGRPRNANVSQNRAHLDKSK